VGKSNLLIKMQPISKNAPKGIADVKQASGKNKPLPDKKQPVEAKLATDKKGKKVKIVEKEPEFSDYYEEENDRVNDMEKQMYSDKYTRVQAAVRVRPFIETEVGFNE